MDSQDKGFEWDYTDAVLTVEGWLDKDAVAALEHELGKLKKPLTALRLKKLKHLDPAAVILFEMNLAHDASIEIPEALQSIWSAYSQKQLKELKREKTSMFSQSAENFSQFWLGFKSFIVLTADTAYWALWGIVRSSGRRKGSVTQNCYTMGVEALGIVALLSLILGFILALQSAIQLKQFGAGLMVANLLTLALIHEMGPIMTSILIAGRTGSSVASEIATMSVTEELDALRMMALDPVRYVLVPKVLAISLVMPLLLTVSIVAGMLGGAFVAFIYLDIPFMVYMNQSLSVVVFVDVVRSYSKTLVFAWVIVIIGAYYGFQVKGGAEGVGRATTQSVVAAIFAILVLDALFSFTLLF